MIREDRLWTTKDGELFLRERMSSTVRDQLSELRAIREDMQKARGYIKKCKERYVKDRLKKKTLSAAAEEDPFKELEDWETRESIRDAYGYDMITEEQMDHLMDLWELREQQNEKNRGKPEFEDRVTKLLDWTMDNLGGAVKARLDELEVVEAEFNRDVTTIVSKHNQQVRSW